MIRSRHAGAMLLSLALVAVGAADGLPAQADKGKGGGRPSAGARSGGARSAGRATRGRAPSRVGARSAKSRSVTVKASPIKVPVRAPSTYAGKAARSTKPGRGWTVVPGDATYGYNPQGHHGYYGYYGY